MFFKAFDQKESRIVRHSSYAFFIVFCILSFAYYKGMLGEYISFYMGYCDIVDYSRHLIVPFFILGLLYIYLSSVFTLVLYNNDAGILSKLSIFVIGVFVVGFFYLRFVRTGSTYHIAIFSITGVLFFIACIDKISLKWRIVSCLIGALLISTFFAYYIGDYKRFLVESGKSYLALKKESNMQLWDKSQLTCNELKYFIHLGSKTFFLTPVNEIHLFEDSELKSIILKKVVQIKIPQQVKPQN